MKITIVKIINGSTLVEQTIEVDQIIDDGKTLSLSPNDNYKIALIEK